MTFSSFNYGRLMAGAGFSLAFILSFSAAVRADTPKPPQRHAEQMIFDPQDQEWQVTPEPEAGTEDGDLAIARNWLAREEYKTAQSIIEDWLEEYPDSPRYPEAIYLKGTCYLELEEYHDAHEAYRKLLDNYPGSLYAEKALSGEFRIAEQYLAGKKRKIWGGLLRISNEDGGLEILNDLIVNYPDTKFAQWALLAKADYYYISGQFGLAEDTYTMYAREYPRTRHHSYALLQAARSALASFAGIRYDESSLIEAQERFTQFKEQYPELARQQEVPVLLEQIASTRADKTLHTAKFYERTEHLQAAKYYYRKTVRNWPETPAGMEAAQKLREDGEGSAPVEAGATTRPAEQG
jgi:outer membrane protein assembly factor BamD (BamD/ComL family)